MHRVIVFSRVELTGLKGNRVTILKEHNTQTYYRGISVELKFRIWSCVGSAVWRVRKASSATGGSMGGKGTVEDVRAVRGAAIVA